MRLPVLKPEEAVKILLALGFKEKRQSGSHLIMRHPGTGKIVPVPIHQGKDLKRGVLRSIIRQTGISVEEFFKSRRP